MYHFTESEESHVHREVEQGPIISLIACLTGNIKYHQETCWSTIQGPGLANRRPEFQSQSCHLTAT